MPKMRAGDVRFEIAVEARLHRRLKATCERLHVPLKYLVLDALTERVEFLEEKRRAEEERRMAERKATGSRKMFGSFRRLSGSTLGPVAKPVPLGAVTSSANYTHSVEPIEYAKHADKIYAAVVAGSGLEVRLCTMEAVAAIKKRYPLTCPKDEVIIAALEKLVLERRETASTITREETAEVVIDVSKMKTFGEVEDDDGG